MAKLLTRLIHVFLLMGVAGLFVLASFFYDKGVNDKKMADLKAQVVLDLPDGGKWEVNRTGKRELLSSKEVLMVGDVIESGERDDLTLSLGGDGVIRLDKKSKLLIIGSEQNVLKISLLEGRFWLNTLYQKGDTKIYLAGANLEAGQTVTYYEVKDGKSIVYANQNNLTLNIVKGDGESAQVLNKLFLPQGTEATVFADKIKDNSDVIAKLLFSKLVKEFNYGQFDNLTLSSDQWLSRNIEKDQALNIKIRDDRLKKIRVRGLKYASLEANNYKIDQYLKDLANLLTFSESKVGDRNLDALYDFLYDAQYLYDNGRTTEGKQRLDQFVQLADRVFLMYGDNLKEQYKERVKEEFEYLSFVSPSDSLYELRKVLEGIYLDRFKGSKEELLLKFQFLTEKLDNLDYYAENKDFRNVKISFEDYSDTFKALLKQYNKDLSQNFTLIQQQNQTLDNLLMKYPEFYRLSFITDKIFIENSYINLLPAGKDRVEEVQTVIAQRIDFLRKLQQFFLDGNVPVQDAQNIVAILISEIEKIALPDEYKVAVTDLFNSRLEDYGVFSDFLNSPEYVSSAVRGTTMKERFAQYKLDNKQTKSISELRKSLSAGTNINDSFLNNSTDTSNTNVLNEENVTKSIDGNETNIINEVDPSLSVETGVNSDSSTVPVKVPRVRRPN